MKPVLLINPNGSEAATASMLSIARRHLEHVEGWTNPDGPPMITDAAALDWAGDEIGRANLPDASGVILAAFGDPGLKVLSARLECPVVGIGTAAALAASADQAAFAVVTTTPNLRDPIDALMRSKGGDAYVGAFMTPGDPLALLATPEALDAVLVAACHEAAVAGAERIIIGGGPLAEAAARIAADVSVPLVQPLPEACRLLAAAL